MSRALYLSGLTPYAAAHALQEALVRARINGQIDDTLLVLEHPPTITLGKRRGALENVLAGAEVPVVQVERGGDVTYHAPGQLVVYPIVALPPGRQDLRNHLRCLEEAVIHLLSGLGLDPARDERNTGVWLPAAAGPPRKVCSIGVAVRSWVSWHGLALNVDVELAGFQRIRPCGFGAEVMDRLADHLRPCPSVQELGPRLVPLLVAALELGPPRAQRLELHAPEQLPLVLSALGLPSPLAGPPGAA